MFKRNLFFIGYLYILLSLSFSCTSKETGNENKFPPDRSKDSVSIPPNTADVKAEFPDISNQISSNHFKLKIKEVVRYGAYTNPIPPGSEIEAFISEDLYKSESKRIKNGEAFIRISQTNNPQNKGYWTIIMFHK
jgi:hypothetical protein